MLKLKIGPGKAAQNQNSNGDSNGQKTPQTPGTGSSGFKLKLNVSQPPTPSEPGPSSSIAQSSTAAPAEKKKRTYTKKDPSASSKSKKRALEDDGAGQPHPKRKISLKIGGPAPSASEGGSGGGPKISLSRKPSRPQPKLLDIRARGKVPPRPKGVGYDSEDSDTEKDPAIQQALILRMQPGPDADYLRTAIAEGRIGPHAAQGDAEISFKFIERNYRRAVIKIQGRTYAAALVDLPCVVESMKSFDKKGWWKVADIAQMLLVLGRCETEEQAKTMPLPRDVNKDTYQYAHGLTPPMHWVRKRRFRKRLNYNEVMNVEEEVNRLLQADKEWEDRGGRVTSTRAGETQQQERMQEQQHEDDEEEEEEADSQANGGYSFNYDAEEDAVETVEYDDEAVEEEGDPDLEAGLQAMFDENDNEDEGGDVSNLVSESPAPIADQAASMAAVENSMQSDIEATPVGTPAAEEQTEDDDDEDDSDDDDDADSPDVVDEDAQAKAAERAQQLEEVADLEREVEKARQKVASMTNQLLAQREKKKLLALEEELNMKRQVFGLELED